jgi:hypothetical protein
LNRECNASVLRNGGPAKTINGDLRNFLHRRRQATTLPPSAFVVSYPCVRLANQTQRSTRGQVHRH